MAQLVPSRQALRHLARLCAASSTTPRCAATAIAERSLHQPTSTPRSHPLRSLTTSTRRQQETSSPASTTNETTNIPTPPPLPDTSTHYTLFPLTLPCGPPPSGPFAIPLPALRREFLALQSQHHPDKFPASTPLHRQSLALSSLINTAYLTLSSPLLRAQYLLKLLHGIDVTSEDNSENLTDQTTLMEVMEAQEQVEEAKGWEEVEGLKRENEERMRRTEEEMGRAFEEGDVEGAKRECLRLKYWSSLEGVLREWEPGKEVRLVH